MSRRRTTKPAPLVEPFRGNQRASRGLFPAGRAAFVDLVDPGGHRLVRVGRYLDELDRERVWWDASTIGLAHGMYENTTAGTLTFTCKTCRDQGSQPVSFVALAEVIAAVASAWDSAHGAPSHGVLHTAAIPRPLTSDQ